MVRLAPRDAGVIFQLQHRLDHAHRIRRTLSIMILVPYGETALNLARQGFLEDMLLLLVFTVVTHAQALEGSQTDCIRSM